MILGRGARWSSHSVTANPALRQTVINLKSLWICRYWRYSRRVLRLVGCWRAKKLIERRSEPFWRHLDTRIATSTTGRQSDVMTNGFAVVY